MSTFAPSSTTFSKRKFLQILAVQGAALTLAACGGGGDDTAAPGSATTAASNSLVITGTSNIPDAGSAIVPDGGIPTSTSSASTFTNLVDGAVNSVVNGNVRTLSVPLAGTAPPAVGSSYAVVLDGANGGSALTLLVVAATGSPDWYFASESGTVKITALSATSVELLFTDVTLAADARADHNSATGRVVLNGTITLRRV